MTPTKQILAIAAMLCVLAPNALTSPVQNKDEKQSEDKKPKVVEKKDKQPEPPKDEKKNDKGDNKDEKKNDKGDNKEGKKP